MRSFLTADQLARQREFRAFVADLLPESQRTRGFAMQSLFIGLGAVIASALPWLLVRYAGVSSSAAGVSVRNFSISRLICS